MAAQNDYRTLWDLDREVYVNHGSFGATPRIILDRQAEFSGRFNANRDRFFRCEYHDFLTSARTHLADFVGAPASDLVFVDNATDGFNAVLKSLSLGPGDEVLISNHIYSNFAPVLNYDAARRGYKVISADISYPPQSDEDIVAAILACVSDATRFAVIDHISSPTALIFPVKAIVSALRERGVECVVDGAHAPGQVALNLGDIGAAYYVGNNHKWLCAPVASGFLYVRPDCQDGVVPAVGSGVATKAHSFSERFDWTGTKSVSERLLVPETIDYMASLHPQGWQGIYEENHEKALAAQGLVCNALGIAPAYSSAMIGCFFTVPLGALVFDGAPDTASALQYIYDILEERFGFGAYIMPFGGQYLLRVSCHLYNRMEEYERLAEAIGWLRDTYGSKVVTS